MSEKVWAYASTQDSDGWDIHKGTREEAIVAALAYFEGHETIYLCEARRCIPSEFVPDAEDVMEIMTERAYNLVGEASDEWPGLSPDSPACRDLEAYLHLWANAHCSPCNFFSLEGEPEKIDRKDYSPDGSEEAGRA